MIRLRKDNSKYTGKFIDNFTRSVFCGCTYIDNLFSISLAHRNRFQSFLEWYLFDCQFG